MTKPEDTVGTTQSDALQPASSQSSATVPPFTFIRDVVDNPADPPPEKLFSLFAQALFSAPVGGGSNSAPSLPAATGPESSSDTAPMLRALVVGFNETELIVLCSLLRTLKFDTTVALNAEEALDDLATSSMDLLVIDWDAPATRALLLAQTVRKMAADQPLIIGLATQLTETLKVSVRGTGFDRIYEKPLSRHVLVECLQGKGVGVSESDFASPL